MARRHRKSVQTKAKEQRVRMQQRRSQTNAKSQSSTSINCPSQSSTSINCPSQSSTSINCPSQSSTSLNCPSQSSTSINCPSQSNTSINCPSQSSTSINCPSQSSTSINCPSQSSISVNCLSQSSTSINCPNQSSTSVNCPSQSSTSVNCPSQSSTSINCPSQSSTSINCLSEGWSSFKTNKSEGRASLKTTKLEGWTSLKTTKLEGWASQKTTNDENEYKIFESQNMESNLNQKENDVFTNTEIPDKILVESTEAKNAKDILPRKNELCLFINGSFHQGNTLFGVNSGKQCVANSLSAVVHSKLKKIVEWDQAYLDGILITGNNIYTIVHRDNTYNYLMVTDLPQRLEIFDVIFQCTREESIISMIDVNHFGSINEFLVMPLDEALRKALSNSDGCFITVLDFTCMIIKQDENIYLFDSHSRNRLGLPCPDGSSILLELNDMEHLYQHCINFVQGRTDTMFEITGIHITIENDFHDMRQFDIDAQSETMVEENMTVSTTQNLSEFKILPESDDKTRYEFIPLDPGSETLVEESIAASMTQHLPDIELLSESDDNVRYEFTPLTIRSKKQLCSRLNLPSKYTMKNRFENNIDMGAPKTTQSIAGDGNCFFRAISYSVSNRQKYHMEVRNAVVRHAEYLGEALRPFLRPQFKSVEEHIKTFRMADSNTWGTELEILAASDLLKRNIFTFFNGSWIIYSPSQINKDSFDNLNNESIYLKNTGNHYEVVTSVFNRDNPHTEQTETTRKGNKRKVEYVDTESDDCPFDKIGKFNVQSDRTLSDVNNLVGHIASKAEKERNKYQACQEIRDRKKSKYHYNTDYRQRIKKRTRLAYREDEEYKTKLRQRSVQKYKNDEKFKEMARLSSKIKYEKIEDFRENVKHYSKKKYDKNEDFRENVKHYNKKKYEKNEDFRENVKHYSKKKYEKNEDFRENVKQCNKEKYEQNEDFRENVKQCSKKKYGENEDFRERVKINSKQKYEQSEMHKNKIKQQTSMRRNTKKEMYTQIDRVISRFQSDVKKGPEYVCACCFRLFFETQVISCKKDAYEKNLCEICISDKYLHRCSENCKSKCMYLGTSRTDLWICYTCHRKLLKGDVPADSFSNNLDLETVPEELKCLNSLEQHLIALNIPFMKVLGLPKGGQKGVHGPVVCVPSDLSKITNTLPRSNDESLMLKVKLKRKLCYKGYEEYQFVNSKHLEEALSFLKNANTWYSDVVLNENWLNPIPEQDENDDQNEPNSVNVEEINIECSQEYAATKAESEDETGTENLTVSYLDEKLQGIQLDTCLQPADIGQEALDMCFDQIFEISPAEGNSPISLLQGEEVEAKSFPVHFPTGKNTFSEKRDNQLTLGRYFNLRLFNVDNRFARDTSYLFFSQYMSELSRVISNVQISLRKETAFTADRKKITAKMLCDKDSLKEMFKKDEAIKFMKPVRGTPPYWQAAQKDIFAMIRQLGIPQFFCSFSSADFRWPEIVETIMRQQGDTRKSGDLSWNEKCKILCSNPVTVARMFDHRFHKFLTNVILSDAEPIGKVVDYFYRVEFQQRGSPHTHCLFWVEGAPTFDEDDDNDVVAFIDKYITCEIPDKNCDPELHDIVTTVHQHSKRHSKTCRKKGTVCRFNFPRPPSEKTFIAKPDENNEEDDTRNVKQQLSQLWEVVLNNNDENATATGLLRKAGLTQIEFEKCFKFITKRNTVVLKRSPQEIFTNQYNTHLLRAWNANMDIQFVLDVYSCVVYIISYISKAEREMGLLLQQTKNEAYEGNLSAQESMKKVGTAYLHHREISAQEAVFRVSGLRLKECSRKVEFIPIGENPYRLSIPLKQVEQKKNLVDVKKQSDSNEGQDIDNTEDTIWMTSMVDRYKERPNIPIFHKMCLARFCSEFSVVVQSQLPTKINPLTTFKLNNNLGYIRQRTRTSPAVIRYPRFSKETEKEKFYQSILQLFLPYRENFQLKPSKFQTYESFYDSGKVILPGENSLLSVKQIVDGNMSLFVKNGQNLEEAERIMEEQGPQEDAWCELCPETEVVRRECLEEGNEATAIEDELSDQSIPDLHQTRKDASFGMCLVSSKYLKNDIDPLLRKLNSIQRQIFFQIREWCLKRRNGYNPEPFHVFVTGGAGTGKSHLIKCIHYEASRLLATTTENPDDLTVLLTAPTGTAAFNINGMTIHSALSIFKSLSVDHATLSEDKINTLRSKLENLQILIIDEVSMVNKMLLFFVHERLRQVKKMSERCPFGGVSVLAVGDFYQLPPVKSKRTDKLYVNDHSNPLNQLWNELFSVVELTEIMRQREDASFAELLNRLRLKSQGDKLSDSDMQSLQQCVRDGPDEALHIFSTNKEVQSYNDEMIFKMCSEPKLIEAEDYDKDKTSGKLVKRRNHFTKSDICLPLSVLLAEGARVMLIKNENVQDGLVNGVMGTVTSIESCSNTSLPKAIFVHFDNENVGKNSKLQKVINQKRSVGLKPCNEDIPFKNGVRRQYPLKLAWACTVHKVQGLTVQECIVDLNRCFTYGQAYVALSRVTCKEGLYLKAIETEKLHKKIHCDPDIAEGVASMANYLPSQSDFKSSDKFVKIFYHNIQGLNQHWEDLKHNTEFGDADLICLTETWLDLKSNLVELEGYSASHMFRSSAFDSSCALFKALKEMQHGGVSVFTRSEVQNEEIKGIVKNMECIIFKIRSIDGIVATIYRTQKYSIQQFLERLGTALAKLCALCNRLIIVGDFNQDILKDQSSIQKFMSQNGFKQLVEIPTTEGGTLIDHVYVRGCTDVSVRVVPTYYSYHEAIEIILKN